MPDRLTMRHGQTILQHTLEQAHRVIQRAITDEDGLDGAEGADVLRLIVDSLGYDPSPKRCGACRKLLRNCEGH